jgi:hypothetical protein
MLSISPTADKQITGMTTGNSAQGREYLRLMSTPAGVRLRRDYPQWNDTAIARNDAAVVIVDQATAFTMDNKVLDYDEGRGLFFVHSVTMPMPQTL